ncbi:MAG: TetR/AcrR family transcriptional regulator [Ilumatobacter sp.]|uniref:TetR/AcrR family transcriptional regulator n=1 Tax=Ilumatobacter sp. TaxID=1967498 RepID=UPI002614D6B6|nr:TetR/AcrR family transcriptional regulator [Ilumatobacter sp.]MDJ0770007.1 TetR/AcrR family transcriptional regulator [Ilumatobacter sp.]
MGTTRGRPPSADSAETEQRILRAARARFARHGFRATTNRLIADDVGITPGAIYHYVDSKAALYAAVYCETIDQVYTEFERAAADHAALLERFTAVMRRACELQALDPSIPGFIVAVAQETQRHPDLLALMAPQRGRHASFFSGLVGDAVANGELAPDTDQRAVADLLGAIMTGVARIAHAAGDSERYVAAVDVLDQLFTGSLVVGGSPA